MNEHIDKTESSAKHWYTIVKEQSPIAAIGFAPFSFGMTIALTSSAIAQGRVSNLMYGAGLALVILGILTMTAGFIIMVFKQLKKRR